MVLHCQMYVYQNFDQSADFLWKSTRTTENGFESTVGLNRIMLVNWTALENALPLHHL